MLPKSHWNVLGTVGLILPLLLDPLGQTVCIVADTPVLPLSFYVVHLCVIIDWLQ